MKSLFAARMAAASVVAIAAAAFAVPASAAGDPVAGLQALSQFNVFVTTNAKINQEVEGKTWIGGNVTGNGGQFQIGSSNGQVAAASTLPSLTVGGNYSAGNLNLNGTNPNGFVIGGTLSAQNVNINDTGSANVVGTMNSNVNLNSGSLTKGGGSGTDGGSVAETLNTSLNPTLQTNLNTQTGVYAANLTALSTQLAGMTADSTVNTADFNNYQFNATPGADGIAVFDITDAATFFSTGKAFSFNLNGASEVIINVNSLSTINQLIINQNFLGDANLYSQKVIWNFSSSIQNIGVGQFDGSILAMGSDLGNTNGFIQGSVAVNAYDFGNGEGGENHLGTFLPPSGPTLPGVPEPQAWALMLLGFGGAGALLRSRRRMAARA